MLERIREGSQGITAKVILGLIILTFAVAGVGNYSNSVDTSVADVNGEKISQNEFEKSFQSQRNRMAQQYGEMFETLSSDAAYMAKFRQDVLNNLINDKVIEQNSAKMAIRVSDAQIKEAIRSMKEFQVDGVFDNTRYLALIQQAGFYQSSSFRDYLRTDMVRRQLTMSVVGSEFALPYQVTSLNALKNQTRDIKYTTISAAQFESAVEVAEAEINEYYQENSAQFENPEQVQVSYVILDIADIAKDITVTADEVNTYYAENISEFTEEDQRRIAHILIEFGDDEETAKTQANELLTRVNNAEDFAELAKEFSADTFSGENGGDLDWIERGTMDDAFDEAAFSLTLENNVSDVVKTEFGFHIIKLIEYKAESVQALDEVRETVSTKLSTSKAQDKFYELQQQLTDLSFEFPDTLEDAAIAVNADVKTSAWLTRGVNAAPFNNPQIVNAAFSDLVLTEQVNSDVIEVSDSVAMVLRLHEYKEANVKPLDEVSALIKSQLTADKAAQQAQTVADELLASYRAGNDISAELASFDSNFEQQENIARYGSAVNRNISQTAFILPHPTEDSMSVSTASLVGGDVALVEVLKVNAGASEAADNTQQQTSKLSQSAYSTFIDALVAEATITRRAVTSVTN